MKIDVTDTKVEGLLIENRHLEIQLKETTEFKVLFERDNEKLREEYATLLEKYNYVNQELSGFQSVLSTQRQKAENQKLEIARLLESESALTVEVDSLKVVNEKLTDQLRTSKKDCEDAVDRLHTANRVRHELEVRLHAELEAAYRLKLTLDEKVQSISDYEVKVDIYETQKRADQQKLQETIDLMQQNQRAFDFKETQLTNRIESINEALLQERDIRDGIIKKFDAEQVNTSQVSLTSMELRAKVQDNELIISNQEARIKA